MPKFLEFVVKLASLAAALVVASAGAAPPAGQDAGVAPPHVPGAAGTGNRTTIRERFPDLDAYLGYLERRSHIGGAWYREIRPGVYQLQTGNLRLPGEGATKRTFTREELERKFGFLPAR